MTTSTDIHAMRRESLRSNRLSLSGRDCGLLGLIIFVLVSRFFVISYPSFDSFFQFGSIIASICAFLIILRKVTVDSRSAFYIGIVALMLLVEGVYSVAFRGESFYHFFSAVYSYVYLLTLPAYLYLFRKYGPLRILRVLQVVAVLISLFMLIAAAASNFAGTVLVESLRHRGGTARFSEAGLVDIAVIYSAWMSFREHPKLRDIFSLTICFASVALVAQTRVMTLTLLLSISCVLVARLRGGGAKLLACILVASILLVATLNGSIASFVGSFSTTGAEASSTYARLDEMNYYLGLFAQHPIMGVGMIAYESPLHYLIGGPYGNYYLDDIGLIGALGSIGLWILPLYVIPLIRFFGDAHRAARPWRSMLVGLVVLLIGTTLTLLYPYPFCDPAWPLVYALFIIFGRLPGGDSSNQRGYSR